MENMGLSGSGPRYIKVGQLVQKILDSGLPGASREVAVVCGLETQGSERLENPEVIKALVEKKLKALVLEGSVESLAEALRIERQLGMLSRKAASLSRAPAEGLTLNGASPISWTPVFCPPEVFGEMMNLNHHLETRESLLKGAVVIARIEYPETSYENTEKKISSMAKEVASRVRGVQPQALIAHLGEYLFEEQKFTGDLENYYDPANSLLPAVLERKKGLPIALSLVYKAIGDRLGLNVHGIGIPGHFLVGVDTGGAIAMIDPFYSGKLLAPNEVKQRVAAQFGVQVDMDREDTFSPVTNRYWLTRFMQNLILSYSQEKNYSMVGALLELEMLLWPEEPRLKREMALVLANVGKGEEAGRWLDSYLKQCPDDPEAEQLSWFFGR